MGSTPDPAFCELQAEVAALRSGCASKRAYMRSRVSLPSPPVRGLKSRGCPHCAGPFAAEARLALGKTVPSLKVWLVSYPVACSSFFYRGSTNKAPNFGNWLPSGSCQDLDADVYPTVLCIAIKGLSVQLIPG